MQALLVFILYVRSTAINPADPGIMSKFDPELMNEATEKHESIAHGLNKFDEASNGTHSCRSSPSQSSFGGANSSKKGSVESVKSNAQVVSTRRSSFCDIFGGIFCAIFVHEDCRGQDEATEQETGEDALFCTLCNAEVGTQLQCFVLVPFDKNIKENNNQKLALILYEYSLFKDIRGLKVLHSNITISKVSNTSPHVLPPET